MQQVCWLLSSARIATCQMPAHKCRDHTVAFVCWPSLGLKDSESICEDTCLPAHRYLENFTTVTLECRQLLSTAIPLAQALEKEAAALVPILA